jgi:hypothetical protein
MKMSVSKSHPSLQIAPEALESDRPLPVAGELIIAKTVRRLLFIGSDYQAYSVSAAITSLSLDDGVSALFHGPPVVRVDPDERVAISEEDSGFDLWVLERAVLGTARADVLAAKIKADDPEARVALLCDDRPTKKKSRASYELDFIDRVFYWQGQPDHLLALVWLIEDEVNLPYDMEFGLPLILLIEDEPMHYSSFIPLIYREIVDRTRELLPENCAPADLIVFMKMRPRLVLAQTFQEALSVVSKFHQNLIGMITDLQFPAGRHIHPEAGIILARTVRCLRPTVPIIIETAQVEARDDILAVNAHFLDKRSPTWLKEIRSLMLQSFGFGKFIFRDANERELRRADNVTELREAIANVPLESFEFHAHRNHFSTWLFIHGAHELARDMRQMNGRGETFREETLTVIDRYQGKPKL